MIEKVDKLHNYLSSTKFDEIDFEQLERMTGTIIADDTYEELPETLQDSIELLDMYELSNLNRGDIDSCLHDVAVWLKSEDNEE